MSQLFRYPPSSSNTLPAGSATAANQVIQISEETAIAGSTASIDSKTPTQGQKTMANSSPVVIASDQSAIPVTISGGLANPLPVHDAALSDKSAAGLVPEAFDYQDITYVAATTRIDQVVYKSGGAGGSVVATLTMGYDGSDRLSSVTKT